MDTQQYKQPKQYKQPQQDKPPKSDSTYRPPKRDSQAKDRRAIVRKLAYGLLGAGVLALLVWAFRPPQILVDTAVVERGDVVVTVDAEGKTRVRTRYVVAAPVGGRVQRIALDPGDEVIQDAVVARIDPLPLTSQVQEAQARLQEFRAERIGVETLRHKPAELLQAEARIRAAEAAHREALAKVGETDAALAQARRDRERFQRLEDEGAVSRQTLETAQLEEDTQSQALEAAQQESERTVAEVEAARRHLQRLQAEQTDPDYLLDVYDARIASVEAELTNLLDEANRTEIYAPSDGLVLRVMQESERFVEAGEPLLEVGNVADMEIVVDVLSADAVKIQPGAEVWVENWGGGDPLLATVRRVEPSAFTETSALGVEEQRVNVLADLIDSPQRLGDGFRIDARFVVGGVEDELKVPLNAVFRCDSEEGVRDRDWCVFVKTEGVAQLRHVDLGPRSRFEVAILDGLEEGELAIVHPSESIADGRRVGDRE